MITGLHHVTATADDAQADLDFYRAALGLRLVKRTVNFDNHFVYHFYYGTERGQPGTIWTTFPYKGFGVRTGVKGTGQITGTAFSVPPGSLDLWRRRFAVRRLATTDLPDRFDEAAIRIEDPSGLAIELVESDADDRPAWPAPQIDPAMAIRGLHGVTLTLAVLPRSVELLVDVLGFVLVGESAGRVRLAAGGDRPGHRVTLEAGAPGGPKAVNGLGTVHHVAFGIADAARQLALREELLARGLQVTEVLDRQYFRSIYFREPGGVLYEVATLGPGFDTDEPLDQLGSALRLPPWEEEHRAAIEARLPPLRLD